VLCFPDLVKPFRSPRVLVCIRRDCIAKVPWLADASAQKEEPGERTAAARTARRKNVSDAIILQQPESAVSAVIGAS
jgi:hypothetical protein